MTPMPISFDDFQKVDIRVGTVISVEPFPEARRPAFKLRIDFGESLGVKKSSAQITRHYTVEMLLGKNPPEVVGLYLRAFHDMNEADWPNLKKLLAEDVRLMLGE